MIPSQTHILFVDESPAVHLQFRDITEGLYLTELSFGTSPNAPYKPNISIDSVFDLWLAQKLIRKNHREGQHYSIMIANLDVFDLDRLELIRQIREIDYEIYVVILGPNDKQLRKEVVNYLGFDEHVTFLSKPLDTDDTLILMRYLIYQWDIKYQLKQRFHQQIFGEDSKLLSLASAQKVPDFNTYPLFIENLNQLLSDAYLAHKNVTIAILDVDHFSLVEHTSSVFLRRKLLLEISGRLKKIANDQWVLGYMSIEKFIIALPDTKDHSDSHERLLELQSYLSEPYEILGVEVVVSFSIGVSLSQNTITDAQELVSYADSALHASRQHGRGVIDFYQPEAQEKLIHNLSLEAALKHALEREELCLVYQPFFHLDTQYVSGVEALIRWQHPELGLLRPHEFLDLAEATGLIKPIGNWVIQEACRQLKNWQEYHNLDLNLAINLSAQQFQTGDLSKILAKSTEENNLEPCKIELELTEQELLENSDLVQTQMNELAAQGYNLVIDDFGVGYSSLQYLNIFPVNKIKIDRSFIMQDSNKHREILKAILLLAQQLNLKTLCEGVETRGQFQHLSHLGCNEIQGFLFCPPIMPEDIPSFIKINRNQRLLMGLLG